MNSLIQFKKATPIFIAAALACVALSPSVHAVSPPPDGGYGSFNTAEGTDALFSNATGARNTGVGFQALYYNDGSYNTANGFRALFNNTTGAQNTATGAAALLMNASGFDNTATGWRALRNNITGSRNTATGAYALNNNTTGSGNTANGFEALVNSSGDANTAIGYQALVSNTGSGGNTAIGYQALLNNVGGNINPSSNTATGFQALLNNTTGYYNTGEGYRALANNTTGLYNTAIGHEALLSNNTGRFNVGMGASALYNNTTGNQNTAVGFALLYNTTGSNNTAMGYNAGTNVAALRTTGSNNTLVGYYAGTNVITASNVICVGSNVAGANVSNTTWIGNVYGVHTQNAATAPVIVSADGQLGTVVSSERFKKDIANMEKASEAILSLRPVTFRYKTDTKDTPQFGLIAEEVAKVNPTLVLPDKEGKPFTVRYEAVNAMLLNEFLKEHRKVEKLEATVERQHKDFDAAVAELKGQIQKVSAQLELNKPVPQTVLNNQ